MLSDKIQPISVRSFTGSSYEIIEYKKDLIRTTSYEIDQATVKKEVHLKRLRQTSLNADMRLESLNTECYNMHRSNSVIMLFITEGSMHIDIEDRHLTLQTGDVCFISPGTRHRESPMNDCTVFQMNSDLRQAAGMIRSAQTFNETYTPLFAFLVRNATDNRQADYLDFTPVGTDQAVTEELIELLTFIKRELEAQKGGFFELVWGTVERIYYYLEDPSLYYCSGATFAVDENDDLYDRILAYLHTHRVRITREELSAVFGYTGGYLNQVFQSHAHETIAAYNRDICIKEAADRISNSDESISSIIRSLGYSSRVSFYKHFSAKYGVTPERYRLLPNHSS